VAPSRFAHHLKAVLLVIAAAMVLGQTLGLVHRLVHASSGHEVGATGVTAPSAAHGVSWSKGLFEEHNEPTCRLYDAVAGGAALTTACSFLPAAFSAHLITFRSGEALSRWAALFEARGPPPAS
jgi:hypothetical protein